ncbi:MAG: hypothetical protein WBN27_11785 [Eudoraea sp.]
MKKFRILFALTVLCMTFSTISYSQTNIEAGVRIGDNIGIDGTIPLGISPRLHPTVYLENFGVGAYFDWLFALNDGPAGLKFYPGVGPEFFFENDFDFNIVGNFGVEYSFNFPLTIGFDWRPGFAVTNDFDFITSNWGFMARYRFKEGGFRRVN